MLNNQQINEILDRINRGEESENDRIQLNDWYAHFDDSQTVVNQFENDNPKQMIWSKINQNITNHPGVSIRRIWKYAAVAASIAIVSFLLQRKYTDVSTLLGNKVQSEFHHNDSLPTEIAMNEADFLDTAVYVEIPKSTSVDRIIETKPQHYVKMLLSDGTKVSLNASSNIRIDDHFEDGKERKVYLSGEAYFEVAKNAKRPFVVVTKDQSIQVLGTKFNVRAYEDQSKISTTLFEGSIKIASRDVELLMKPNQTVTNDGRTLKLVDEVNTKIASDWRNLKYSFNDESIKDVLSQLSKKYGLEVRYHGDIPNLTISGKLDNAMTLEEIMMVMSNLTGGNFKLKGNELSVNFL